jgi:hypothetical protein
MCLFVVQKDGSLLEFVKNQTPEICLAAVQNDGYSLKFVKKQTPKICLAAVQNDGYALQFVKKKTPELCLAAVKKNGRAIEFVVDPTEEMCLEAVKENGKALMYIKEPTSEMFTIAENNMDKEDEDEFKENFYNEKVSNYNYNSFELIIEIINELLLNDTKNLYENSEIEEIKKYIFDKYKEKSLYSYNPDANNKKILFLIAAHTNSKLKLNNVKSLINLILYDSIEIMVLNTNLLSNSKNLKDFCKKKNIFYCERENFVTCDFGKWVDLLNMKKNYHSYDYIFFANDSFIIEDSINHFINLTIKNNLELYAYNDSTEEKFHYQSYLFAIKSDAIYKFINMYYKYNKSIKCFRDLIINYELNMVEYFTTHSCFLNIGDVPGNKGLNIFFHNDYLYEILKNIGLLPFVKLKRIN